MQPDDSDKRTHHVSVYEHGTWVGYLTPRGTTNRLRVHAGFFSEAGARRVADEITAENQDSGMTGKAVRAWPRRRS